MQRLTMTKQAANLIGARLVVRLAEIGLCQRSTKDGRRAAARAAAVDHLLAGLGAVALPEPADAALLEL